MPSLLHRHTARWSATLRGLAWAAAPGLLFNLLSATMRSLSMRVGALHTAGLCLWFVALPHIPLADTTAIGFTTPLFIMIGAFLVFREPMRRERWAATGLGFVGVMIVVAPKLSGSGGTYHLLMLA